jgi:DUF1680 family protein
MKTKLLMIYLLLIFPAGCLEKPDERVAINLALEPFPMNQVKLLDGPFRDAMELDRKYLLSLDMDRLLSDFRKVAGLPVKAQPYGGWESSGLNGHTLGHYLSACAMMFASTSEQEFKTRVDYIVSELSEIQDARGTGFIGGIPPDFFEKSVFDPEGEISGFRLGGIWSPWYNIHKVFAGLIDAFNYGENEQALRVVSGLAGWAVNVSAQLSDDLFKRMLDCEFGGMNEALANLYAITGKKEYLDLAIRFDHDKVFGPLEKGQDRLKGLHANTQIPKITGAARIFEMTGNPKYEKISSFFWDEVVGHHTYVHGGNSHREHFGAPDSLSDRLSDVTSETCNTYNMLKLTRHLFMWTGDIKYADYYERALYNHILASQDHETGMMLYFAALRPGFYKIFNSPESSFWCCTGTGMENHASYNNSIYFHDKNSLWINLFIPSEINWREKGLIMRQETRFPEQDKILLIFLEAPRKIMPVNIRIPYWAFSGASVKVNGQKENIEVSPGMYAEIIRKWKKNDTIEVEIPLSLHTKALPDNKNRFAFLYGPVVLAGNFGETDVPREWHFPDDNVGVGEQTQKGIEIPQIVGDLNNLSDWIRPVNGQALSFRTIDGGVPGDVNLTPFYRINYERYTIYWDYKMSDRSP